MVKRSPLVALLLVRTALCALALPPGYQSEPTLRVNTETHTSFVQHISIDPDGRYLVSASGDMTARLWDARSGALIRVLRPPIGSNTDAVIESCALSPNGRSVVIGGRTVTWGSSNRAELYAFDAGTGLMVWHDDSLPGFPADLAYSQDGRYLAVALLGGGARIIDPATWSVVSRMNDVADRCRALSFDSTGRLATIGEGGELRLFDPSFKTSQHTVVSAGQWPTSIDLSPDGSRIAVGFQDTNRIEIRSGKDLRLLETLSGGGSAYFSVCWSTDGESLLAGGWNSRVVNGKWVYYVERFGPGTLGSRQAYPVARDTILDIEETPNGDILYCGIPDVGRLGRDGKVVYVRSGDSLHFNGTANALRVNSDGTRIGFGIDGESPLTFDLNTLELGHGSTTDPTPRSAAPGVEVTGWPGRAPKINGVRIFNLRERERVLCAAISSAVEEILMGADWHTLCFRASGRLRWKLESPAVWAINFSGDGRLYVAAYSDGTLRWGRVSDGKTLLTLFVHGGRKRWLVWTPDGYFASSAGGEDLAGWHFNNGVSRAALFYPLSRFAEKFRRPDIVRRALTAPEVHGAGAFDDLAAFLPPVTAILEPRDGSSIKAEAVPVDIVVSAVPGRAATEVRVSVDGRVVEALPAGRIASTTDGVQRVKLALGLEDGEHVIEAAAGNGAGLGDPARVKFEFARERIAMRRLNFLALVTASGADGPGRWTERDAREIGERFVRQQNKLYSAVELLAVSVSGTESAEQGFSWLRSRAREGATSMLLLEGTVVPGKDGEGRLVPAGRLPRTAPSATAAEIAGALAAIPGRVVVLADLHGAAGPAGGMTILDRFVDTIASSHAMVVAAKTVSSAPEPARRQASELRRWLLSGLDGEADYTRDGWISLNELEIYLRKHLVTSPDGAVAVSASKPPDARDFPVARVVPASGRPRQPSQ